MARHMFANDIRPALESGERRITVPSGARLSPAAADLIKDYGAEVVFSDERAPVAAARSAALTAPKPQAKPASTENSRLVEVVKSAAGAKASDADVEKILERVVARLAETKGEPIEPGAEDAVIICRCEEITRGQIREAIASGMATLNGIKRVTRAGMGLCQGQTCQRLVTQLLCQELGLDPAGVKPISDRPPTRPIPLNVLATG
ncbi:MAG TPA: (2Fe-2S)-binding protein [Deferrisomatales bacterium]|nr:(2Fe-2S)-binding protein [Deferrisomatales bacterium]